MTPREGLKVADLARIAAGPWGGQALAEPGDDRSAACFYAANRGEAVGGGAGHAYGAGRGAGGCQLG